MTSYGVHVTNTSVPELVAIAQRAEAAGVGTLWLTSGLGPDSLTSLAVVGAQTERIRLGTAIAIAYSRHPLAMIQQARAIEDVAPGRLQPGHRHQPQGRPSRPRGACSFDRPLGFLREYLEVLRQARTGELDFDGARISRPRTARRAGRRAAAHLGAAPHGLPARRGARGRRHRVDHAVLVPAGRRGSCPARERGGPRTPATDGSSGMPSRS